MERCFKAMKLSKVRFPGKTFIVLMAVAAVFGALVLSARVLINTDYCRAWVSRKVEAAVGARGGFRAVSLSLLPWPSLTLHRPWLAMPGTAYGQAEALQVQPAIWPILTGRLRLERIVLKSPVVRLDVRPAAGKTAGVTLNLPDLAERFRPGLRKMAEDFAGTRVQVSDGRLVFSCPGRDRLSLEKIGLNAGVTAGGTIEVGIEAACGLARSIRLQMALNPETLESSVRGRLRSCDLQAVAGLITMDGGMLPRGRADLDLEAESSGARLSARVTLTVADLVVGGGFTGHNLKAVAEVDRDPDRIRIRLPKLQLARPALDMTAALDWRLGKGICPEPELSVHARHLDVSALKVALAAAGSDGFRNALFAIVRQGQVSGLDLSSRAATWKDLFTLDNIRLTAALASGSLSVPVLEWDLEQVSGNVTLEKGILAGRNLAATKGATGVSGGTLRLGLDGRKVFYLDCDFRADLAHVPDLVRKFAAGPVVSAELRRIGSLSGTAGGHLTLEQKEGAWQMEVRADQVALEADYDRLPGKIEIRRGRAVFTGRRLELDRMEGNIGQSSFSGLCGRLDWSGPPAIDLRQATFRLNVGQLYAWAEPLLGRLAEGYRLRALAGWADITDFSLKGPLTEPSRWRLKAGMSLYHLVVDSGALPACLEIDRADLSLDSGSLAFSNLSMTMGGTVLGGSGAVKGLFTSGPRLELTLKGQTGRAFRHWLLKTFNLPSRIRAGRSMVIDQLRLSAGKGFFEIETEAASASGVRLSLAMSLSRSGLDIRRLLLRDDTTRALIALRHPAGSGHWQIDFSGRLTAATLDKLWELPEGARGEISGKAHIFLDQSAPGASSLNGSLEMKQVAIPAGPFEGVGIDRALVTGKGDRICVSRARIQLYGDRLGIDGRMEMNRDSVYLDLKVRAAVLHADRIQEAFASPGSKDGKGGSKSRIPPYLKGIVAFELGRVEYGRHTWEPFNAMAILDGATVSARLVDVKVCGISVAGSIKLVSGGVALNLRPSLAKSRLKYPLGCLAGADTSERIEGSLEVSGHLVTSGSSRQQLLDNLRGRLAVNMRDGRVFNMGGAGLFTNIISYLKINRLVTGDLPDLRSRDLPFESISARMVFKGSRIVLEDAQVKARVINIVCEGEMDMASRTMNLTMLVSPLTSIDWIISHTPILGKILKGTLVAIPVSVRGPLGDPAVVPLSPRAVGSRILGILGRALKAPFELIQPLFPKTAPAPGENTPEEDGAGP